MKELIINSIDEFKAVISSHDYHQWIYRGQNNYEYQLESSLFRAFRRNEKIRSATKMKRVHLIREKYEKEMIESFQKSCHLFLTTFPNMKDKFDWLSLMQHYGAPTRLLDFSLSPYVALYFSMYEATEEAAVYCINYSEIKKIDSSYYNNIDQKYSELMKTEKSIDQTLLVPFEPKFINERLFAQQGVFLIPNTLNFSHHEILENYENSDFYLKLKINITQFAEIQKELLKMNIRASSVYPGFEGFCKSFNTIGIIPIGNIRSLSELIIDMN